MLANFGYGLLVITFFLSIYGAIAAVVGARKNQFAWVESARLSTSLAFLLVSISTGILLYFLISGHYEVEFVYSVASQSMPPLLRLTALWGGQSGSLLFWAWLISGFSAAAALRQWDRDREFLPWVILVLLVTLAFFLGLIIFVENPFNRLWLFPNGTQISTMFQPQGGTLIVPSNGSGLNPMLRHPGMIFHPPMLYLGFVAFTVPFAYAIAALVTGRTDDRWIRLTRRWTLAAWLFLSLGLVLGMRWAYDVLGWGGYWSWDPVEIAALMPWLTGTAFLHSVMIQEKRGMMKRWNMVLVILTYDLVIFGTFLTRSGVLSSVHAFAQSAIGPLFFVFIGVTFAVSLGLLLYRWNDLRSENVMHSLLSRESLFLFNNLFFMGIFLVCFWGVLFPLISEIFTGQKVTVGPPFYERATGPLWACLLLLMGVAPLSAWQHSNAKTLGHAMWKPFAVSILVLVGVVLSGVRSIPALIGFWLVAYVGSVTLYEYGRGVVARHHITGESIPAALWHLAARNRRRYGGYIIHLAIILMALGVIGIELFQTETQGTLRPGEQLTLGSYSVRYDSLAEFETSDGRSVARAVVTVFKGNQPVAELYPRRDYYYESQQSMTIPGVRSTMEDDLYVILADWQPISTQGATFKVYHNPLVNWMWLGGLLLILGSLVAALPGREPGLSEVRSAVVHRSPNG